MEKMPENPYASKGGYTKLKEGKTQVRMFDFVEGWEYWIDKDGNIVPRSAKAGEGGKPIRIKLNELEDQKPETRKEAKYFRAYKVWNYDAEAVQVLQLTQRSIIEPLITLSYDEDWGKVEKGEYDIVISRTGEGLETEYQVTPKPKKDFDWSGKENTTVNLEALFAGENPFTTEGTDQGLVADLLNQTGL